MHKLVMDVSMETNSCYKVNSLYQSYSILGDMRTLLGNTETACWIVFKATRVLKTIESVGEQEVPTTYHTLPSEHEYG